MVDISIIVPTKKRPRDVDNLLKDLSAQSSEQYSFEVLIFNDGRDKQTEIICQNKWPFDVVYLLSENQSDSCAARNSCIERSRGREALIFLDDDVRLESDFLRNTMKNLDKYEAFSCRIVTPNSNPSKNFWPASMRRKVIPILGLMTGGFGEELSRVVEVDHLPGCMMAFRSDITEGVRFDPWLGNGNGYLDDADYSYSIKQKFGIKLHYVSSFSIIHLQTPSGGNREKNKKRWWYYSALHRRWFFKKHLLKHWGACLYVETFIESILRSVKYRQSFLGSWHKAMIAELPEKF